MASNTPKLGLTKPDPTDETVVLEDFNGNMDLIDAAAPPTDVVSVSADHVVTDERYVIVDSSSAGLVVISLPDAAIGRAVTVIRTDEVDAAQTQIQVAGTSVTQINGRGFYIFMRGAYEFVCIDGTTWVCSSSPIDLVTSIGDVTVPGTVMVPRWSPGSPGNWVIQPMLLADLGDMVGVGSPADGNVIYWDATAVRWQVKPARALANPPVVGGADFDFGPGSTPYDDLVYLVDTSAQPVQVTLPDPLSGLRVSVKKADAAANDVTVVTQGGTATIDGAASVVLSAQYDYVALVGDGVNWWIFGGGA